MSEPLRVGVAGLGTVGVSVVRILARQENALAARCGRAVRVTAVSSRDRTRDRGIDLRRYAWFDDPVAMARSGDVDCVVELIGGADGPARETVEAALTAGRHVVTANKALLARHGLALARMAEARGVALAFEASSAGGIPVVKTLREALAGNAVSRLYGILNGTCNYILSRMELEGLSFADCLKDAQRLGYAEADPTFDVEGFDTAHKLAILTSLAFGTELDADAIYVEGISKIAPLDLRMADELGFRIKLLGVAERTKTGIEQRVHPTMVPKSSAIAQVMGVTNAVTVDADAVRELTLIGPGAGGDPTASAVVADIADVASAPPRAPFGRPVDRLDKPQRAPMQRHEGGYYIRLTVHDRPGVAAGVATRMAEADISLESILQKRQPAAAKDPHGRSGEPVPLVLITYAAAESTVRETLERIAADGLVSEPPQVIRIERERGVAAPLPTGHNTPSTSGGPMLVLRSSPASPFGRKVKIAAALLGLSDRIEIVAADTTDPDEALRAQNPLGKIPTLVLESGETLFDSRVIVEYLDHLAGGGRLIPAGDARFPALRLQALADGLADAALLQVYESRFRPEGQRVQSWVDHQAGKVGRALAALEAGHAEPGRPVTVGEIAQACALGYLDLRFAGAWRAERPRLAAWLADFEARVPAFAATRMPA